MMTTTKTREISKWFMSVLMFSRHPCVGHVKYRFYIHIFIIIVMVVIICMYAFKPLRDALLIVGLLLHFKLNLSLCFVLFGSPFDATHTIYTQ